MRDFQARVSGRDAIHFAATQPEPSVTVYSRPRSAMSCIPTQMPRKGRPGAVRLIERLNHSWNGIKPAPAVGERAHAPATQCDPRA